MFTAQVYRIAIHSLGAILEEEYLAKLTIDKWNEAHSESCGKIFLQVPGNSTASTDINVVIIDSYIDIAAVDKVIKIGKPVVLLFNKYHDPKNTLQSELEMIESYREVVKDRCICYDFENKSDFSNALIKVLNRKY